MSLLCQEAEIDKALRLLQVERDILLSGNLEGLQHVLAEKQGLISRFPKSDGSTELAAKLKKLKSLSEQNLKLSEVAREGLNAMQGRLTEILSGSKGLTTYNRHHETVMFKTTSPVRRA